MKLTIVIPPWARHIVSDLTDMERNPHPVDAGKVSSFTLTLPDDVYFEYAFLDEGGEMRSDPENSQRADNPWYKEASAVTGPAYRPDPYASPSQEAEGAVKRHRLASQLLGETRRIITYTPTGHESAELPAVYLQDGVAYYRTGRLADVLEALLADSLVRPAHLVFIEPTDRSREYRYNPDYRRFIVEELVPFVEGELAVSGERVAMGASLGGLMSASLGIHHPELFGTVVSQSGAFMGSPEEPDFYEGKTSWLLEQLEAGEGKGLRWHLQTGTLEWLHDVNRRAAEALEAGGYVYTYAERNAGHNWVNWRNGLSRALRFALAP